jgi:hypothetical protein
MNKTDKLQKVQQLLNRLNDLQAKDPVRSVERLLEEEKSKTREVPHGTALKVLAKGIENLQKDPRIDQMSSEFTSAKSENQEKMEELSSTFSKQIESLMEELKNVEETNKTSVQSILERLAEYEGTFSAGMQDLAAKDSELESEFANVVQSLTSLSARLDALPDYSENISQTFEDVSRITKETENIQKDIDKLRKDLTNRINNIQQHGGGNANRSILVGGDKDTLKYFTDINLKAGAGTTITYSANQTTKYTDITITATGSGSGITRSVNVVAIDTAAGAAPSIDYVYVVSGNTIITLPTAVGNTNLYTVKNVGSGVVSIATTGGQTIDGSASPLQLPLQYTSVDLISNGSTWDIT